MIMAKFTFKLKSILNLKRQLEEQVKFKLGRAIGALNRELSVLRSFEEAISMTVDEFRIASGGVFTAGRIKEYNYFITRMKEKAAEQRIVVSEAEAYVSVVRAELLAAVQQRKMYERLREKAYDKYLDEEKHAEQLVVDELISYKIGSSLHGETT